MAACPNSNSTNANQSYFQTNFANDSCSCQANEIKLKIYEMGLIESNSNPINISATTPPTGSFSLGAFSNLHATIPSTTNGVVCTVSSSSTAPSQIPGDSMRPPNGSYQYSYIIISPTINIKSEYKFTGGTRYRSKKNGNAVADGSDPEFYPDTINSFDDPGQPHLAVFSENLLGGASVRALLLQGKDLPNYSGVGGSSISTATTNAQYLFAVFTPTKPVVIDKDTKGINVNIGINNAVDLLVDGSGTPTNFWSAPFTPIFKVI